MKTTSSSPSRLVAALLVVGAVAARAEHEWPSEQQKAWLEQLRAPGTAATTERELRQLAAGHSGEAAPALSILAAHLEHTHRYDEALAMYRVILERFAHLFEGGQASLRIFELQATHLWAPRPAFELPGNTPHIWVQWRNVPSVSWTLLRVDPFAIPTMTSLNASSLWRDGLLDVGEPINEWTTRPDGVVPYQLAERSFPLPVREPGLYVVDIRGGAYPARVPLLITRTATVAHTDGHTLWVWVCDVETGVAQPNAQVMLWRQRAPCGDEPSCTERVKATTNAQGLATFATGNSPLPVVVWSKVGANYSMSQTDERRGGHEPYVSYRTQALSLAVDASSLECGQPVRARVRSARGGGHVMFSLERDRVYALRVVALRGHTAEVELPAPPGLAPGARLIAIRFEGKRVLRDELTLRMKCLDRGHVQVSDGAPEVPVVRSVSTVDYF